MPDKPLTAHVFKYELVNPDRNITKEGWKKIQRWLREVRNIVEGRIDWQAANKAVMDAMITGEGHMIQKNKMYGKSPIY